VNGVNRDIGIRPASADREFDPSTGYGRAPENTMNKSIHAILLTLAACGGGGKTTDSAEGSTTTPQTTTDASTGPGNTTTVTSSGSSTAGSVSESDSDATTTVTTGTPGTSTSSTTDPTPGTTTSGGGTTSDETTTKGEETKGEETKGEETKGEETGDVCVDQEGSCAKGELCCPGLQCCAGVPVPPGKEFCSDMCPISDRNAKTEIRPVDASEILGRVVGLEISTWQYRKDGPEVRHLGPMAQDFKQAFGLWDTDRMIFPLDASGVSLAAIQALHRRVVDTERENEDLRARLDRLETELIDLRRERR